MKPLLHILADAAILILAALTLTPRQRRAFGPSLDGFEADDDLVSHSSVGLHPPLDNQPVPHEEPPRGTGWGYLKEVA